MLPIEDFKHWEFGRNTMFRPEDKFRLAFQLLTYTGAINRDGTPAVTPERSPTAGQVASNSPVLTAGLI